MDIKQLQNVYETHTKWGVEMEVLAKRLKWLREKERYSQKDIAIKIGMTPSGYQKIEYGERDPKLDVLVSLCEIYNVNADFLLGRNDRYSKLAETMTELISLLTQIEMNLKSNHEILNEISYVESKLQKINRENVEEIEESNNLKSVISAYEKRKIENEHDIKINQQKISKVLRIYIEEMLSIPDAKVYDDYMIKKIQPINITILHVMNDFRLQISSEKTGYITLMGSYFYKEEAEKKREELLLKLNGD